MLSCTSYERDAMAVFSQQLGVIRLRLSQGDRQQHQPAIVVLEAPQGPTTMSLDDWDVLFRAVTTRLRLTLGGVESLHLDGSAAPLQTSLLECVDALDQLHVMLHQTLARDRQA